MASVVRKVVCINRSHYGILDKIFRNLPQDYLIALPPELRQSVLNDYCKTICLAENLCICKNGHRICTTYDSGHPMSAFRITRQIHSYKMLVNGCIIDFRGDMERNPFIYQAKTYTIPFI